MVVPATSAHRVECRPTVIKAKFLEAAFRKTKETKRSDIQSDLFVSRLAETLFAEVDAICRCTYDFVQASLDDLHLGIVLFVHKYA